MWTTFGVIDICTIYSVCLSHTNNSIFEVAKFVDHYNFMLAA